MTSNLNGPTLTACQACAVLIANDDDSGDAFARDPEWRRTALSLALARHGACWPVVASGLEDTRDACSFCGDPDPDLAHAVATMSAAD